MDNDTADRIARSQRRFREALWFGLALGVFAAALGILWVWADRSGQLLRLGLGQAEADRVFFAVMAAALLAALVFAIVRYWVPKAERDPAYLRVAMDTIHRQWRWTTLLLSAVAVLNTFNFVRHPLDRTDIFSWLVIFMLAMLALLVCFGPGFLRRRYSETLNDELMRIQRAKAARLGYLTAIAGLAALFFVVLARPDAAPAAVVIALCAAAVLPAFYFVFLDWRSERGETP